MPGPNYPSVEGSMGQVGEAVQKFFTLLLGQIGSDLELKSTNMDFCVSSARNIE